MSNQVNIEIISVDGYLFQGPAFQVVAPTVEGNIGVLADHEFLITELKEGKIEVLDANNKTIKEIDVKTGTLEVHDGGLRILIDS